LGPQAWGQRRPRARTGQVVDLLLVGLHARHVLVQADHLVARLAGVEAQQLGQAVAVGRVLDDAQLDRLAELRRFSAARSPL